MTKMLTQSSIAALATIFAVSAPAQASDILTDPSTAYVQGNAAPARVNWTGLYVGGRVGYGNANHDLTVERYNGAYCWDQVFNQNDQVSGENTTSLDNPTDLQDGWNGNFFGTNPTSGGDPVYGLVSAKEADGTCAAGIGADDSLAIDPSSRNAASIDGVNSHGLIGGTQVGYDQQLGSRWLLGVFGSYDLSQIETTADNALGISNPDVAHEINKIEKGDEWSIGVRAGKLVTPETLVYLLAAYTQTDYDFSGISSNVDGDTSFSKTTTFDGVSVGGGVEFALTSNIFAGLEYTHTFYGKETVLDTDGTDVGGFGQRLIDDLDEDKVMATIKIKLNSDVFGN